MEADNIQNTNSIDNPNIQPAIPPSNNEVAPNQSPADNSKTEQETPEGRLHWKWWFLAIIAVIILGLLYGLERFFFGTLVIKGDYKNITVEINNKTYDKLPLNLKLKKGQYNITIAKELYLPYTLSIEVKAGEKQNITPALQPILLVNYVNKNSFTAPKLSANGNYIHYFSNDTTSMSFYRMPAYFTTDKTINANKEQMSSALQYAYSKTPPIVNVNWSPDSTKALIKTTGFYRLFNYQNKKWTNLGYNIIGADFAGNGAIIYATPSTKGSIFWLKRLSDNHIQLIKTINFFPTNITTNSDGNRIALFNQTKILVYDNLAKKILYEANENTTSATWLNKKILLVTKKEGFGEKLSALNVYTKSKNIIATINEGNYVAGENDKIFYVALNDMKPQLVVYNYPYQKSIIYEMEFAERPKLVGSRSNKIIFTLPSHQDQLLAVKAK